MEVDSGSGAPVSKARSVEKPPDVPTRKLIFKEKVLGVSTEKETGFRDLLAEWLMKVTLVEDNEFFPMFDIEPQAYANICKPWEDCLVVKLLGKHIRYGALCAKLKTLWKLLGGYEVRDVHHGYFLIKFEQESDKENVMMGVPWMIYDHYLAVKPWTPDFVAANSKISTTMVWIRIPGLGFQFYDKNILSTLASATGKPIKVDMNTTDMRRGKYARICVEINLTKPVKGVIGFRNVIFKSRAN